MTTINRLHGRGIVTSIGLVGWGLFYFLENIILTTITATLVPEHQRLLMTPRYFKQYFPFKIEPVIYHFARHLCQDYRGAYWHFYTLSNGGFYMAPDSTEPFNTISESGFEGQVSADAFGVIACLYAYSHLSFSDNPELSRLCSSHYHHLREFALEHGEATAISRAID